MNEKKETNPPNGGVKKKYRGLLHEYGIIMAILSDKYLDQIHCQIEGGYYEAINILSEAAIEFYQKFKKEIESEKEDWVQICAQYNTTAYEDVILIHAARYIINKHYSINLKLK